MLCDIDQEIKGKLFNSKEKRNVTGMYAKHKLVSSHICRRSFCSNLYGVIPNHVLQSICGWSTEGMMLNYMKKTKRESADVLKTYWKEKYNQNT